MRSTPTINLANAAGIYLNLLKDIPSNPYQKLNKIEYFLDTDNLFYDFSPLSKYTRVTETIKYNCASIQIAKSGIYV